MNRAFGGSTTLAMMFWLAACQSLADGAKETFSKDYSCPVDRVESRDRPDLRRSSFDTGPTALTPKPPPDIAADPGRLAVWRQHHQQPDPTQFDDLDDIEETHGCGKDAFYFCHGGQRHSFKTRCALARTVPPTVSHW